MFAGRLTFCLLCLFATTLHAEDELYLPYMPNIHVEDPFEIPGDKRRFVRHTFYPTEDESLASIESQVFHVNLESYIRNAAKERGFLVGRSGEAYRRELAIYVSGRWPLTYIATEDEPFRPLVHMAFAVRWEDLPLPWESRFLGDDDQVLPPKIHSPSLLALGGHVRHHFQTFPELNSKENKLQIYIACAHQTFSVGERTEFKFLEGEEPSKILMREMFHGAKEYELARYSFCPVPNSHREEHEAFLQIAPIDKDVIQFLTGSFSGPHAEEFAAFMREHIRDTQWQKYISNTWVYGHISGEPKGELSYTARMKLFEKRLNVPPPLLSFIEGPGIGKVGIRTDISLVKLAYFEDHILTSLDDDPEIKDRVAIYTPWEERKPSFPPCHLLLGQMEQAFIRYRKAHHPQAI